jgi:hypothetical protein
MNISEPIDLNLNKNTISEPAIKLKESCVLSAHAPAQQEELFDWLELHPAKTVLEMVAAPPPEGFGIKTHLTSLRRFHARARTCFHREITAAPLELLPEPGSDPIALDKLTATALRQFAVEMATVQERDTARFGTVSRWVLRLQQNAQRERELKIAEDRLALMKLRVEMEKSKAELEKTKFEYNAARAALHHLPELRDVLLNQGGDNEDKIWATRDKIFPPRSDLIENPNLQSASNANKPTSAPISSSNR